MSPAARPYTEMIRAFLDGRMSPREFSAAYFARFQDETDPFTEPEFQTLDRLFADLDAYCDDPDLRDEGDIDEDELRECSRRALDKLSALPDG